MAHEVLEALVSREGDQCVQMYTEPSPLVCGWLLKPRWPIQSRHRIWDTSNRKDSLVQQTAVRAVILPHQSQSQTLNPACVWQLLELPIPIPTALEREGWGMDGEMASELWPTNMIVSLLPKLHQMPETLYPAPVLHTFLRMFWLILECNRSQVWAQQVNQ